MHGSTPQPKRLGRYEITGTIAVGPRWRIYKALDASQREVVLKAIPRKILDTYAASARFQNDARAATALDHPGIVRLYEYGEDADLAFVAMELVHGWHLKERFRVPLPDAVNLTVQLLDALDYAHEKGIVHGEIRPSNLLLTGKGHLRITNFGVARLGADTPNFLSPEQLTKAPVDRRTDIFSAGLFFYELLTGSSPFGGTPQDIARGICSEKERPPSQVNPGVPHAFDAVSAKALAKLVDDRYPTARAFCDRIHRVFESPADSTERRVISRVVSNETIIAFSAARAQSDRGPGVVLSAEAKSKPIPREPLPPPGVSAPGVSANPPGAPPKWPSLASELKGEAKPASDLKPSPSPVKAAPDLKPSLTPLKAPDLKPNAAPANLAPDVSARLEELLGKQPETLAAYLNDGPSEAEQVVQAFVSSTRALIAMYEAQGKKEALIPQNIAFDRMGKATIRTSAAVQGTTLMSNPRYAAPEMFAEKGSGADSNAAAANVYALGVMIYEILLGRKLFEKTFADQRTDIDWLRWNADLESKAPPLKSLHPDCPVALSDLLESMMEKHLDKRVTDLNEILTRGRNIAQRANKTMVLQGPAKTKAPVESGSVPRKKSWATLVLLVILLFALGAAGAVYWQNPEIVQEIIPHPEQRRLIRLRMDRRSRMTPTLSTICSGLGCFARRHLKSQPAQSRACNTRFTLGKSNRPKSPPGSSSVGHKAYPVGRTLVKQTPLQ